MEAFTKSLGCRVELEHPEHAELDHPDSNAQAAAAAASASAAAAAKLET